MPLKTPSSPAKATGKPKGKTVTPSSGKSKTPAAKGKSASHAPPVPVRVSWWSTLSPERKLDVVGAVMSVLGILILLILFSAQKSALTGSMIHVFQQMLGWGIYILPVALILMGLWLILRRIEKLPPLSLERATGIILFFLWLLTLMHSIIPLETADQAVLLGVGGGYIGNLFARILLNGFGRAGAIVILFAWLLITVVMIFDISVADLFRWVNPLLLKIREQLAKPIKKVDKTFSPEVAEVASNGYTPLHRPQPVVKNEVPGLPVKTVKPAEAVINWQLPDVKQILDSGTAPSVNEEFIEQRAR